MSRIRVLLAVNVDQAALNLEEGHGMAARAAIPLRLRRAHMHDSFGLPVSFGKKCTLRAARGGIYRDVK